MAHVPPEAYAARAAHWLGEPSVTDADVAIYLHDETIECEICRQRFDSLTDFASEGDLAVEGRWVCLDCASGLPPSRSAIDAERADRWYDERRDVA